VKNSFGIPIKIPSDAAIQKSCGCTTLECSARELPPGAESEILMRVNTQGKSGHFSVSAVINWAVGAEATWPMHLLLQGTANAVLAAEPILVQFSATDVQEGKEKELAIYANLPVDWQTLRVYSEPPYLEVAHQLVATNRTTLKLRATPPTESREFSATLFATVALSPSADGEVKSCSLRIPVNGVQQIGVQVAPSVVMVRIAAGSDKGSAHFVLRGDDLPAGPRPIDSIDCAGFNASWDLRELSARNTGRYRTFHVDLKLSRREGVNSTDNKSSRAAIVLNDGRPLEVPLMFVRPEG
jgi:hypothetical protein